METVEDCWSTAGAKDDLRLEKELTKPFEPLHFPEARLDGDQLEHTAHIELGQERTRSELHKPAHHLTLRFRKGLILPLLTITNNGLDQKSSKLCLTQVATLSVRQQQTSRSKTSTGFEVARPGRAKRSTRGSAP